MRILKRFGAVGNHELRLLKEKSIIDCLFFLHSVLLLYSTTFPQKKGTLNKDRTDVILISYCDQKRLLNFNTLKMAGVSDDVLGKFQLDKSENFDSFMAALGVGWATRTLGNKTTPVVTVSKDEADTMTFKQESLVSTSQISFKIGQPFDEKTADGRKVRR